MSSKLVNQSQKYAGNTKSTPFSGKGNVWTAEARIAQYERLVGELYAENRLLKKALEKLGQLREEKHLRS
jgi:hypothetical protein